MEISSSEGENQADYDPLLMVHAENHNDLEHIIDITRSNGVSSSSLQENHTPGSDPPAHEDWPLNGAHISSYQASSSPSRINSRSSSSTRRNEGYSRRRSPLNSGVWISIEFFVTMSQIIASVVVLYLARDEKPQEPLFLWVVGYASVCVATLPILFWRFLNRNQGTEQDSNRLSQQSSEMNPPFEPTSYTAITVNQSAEEPNHHTMEAVRDNHPVGALGIRINGLVDHLKMALDCFFAVWFVVGNVWIFGGHSSSVDAPILYRLCIVFLTFSCIGYAMPFILCATICCCLPCIISILGFRGDSQTRGASSESINALPTYHFKLKDSGNDEDEELNSGAGGILAEGSEKERFISGEDAVCCICLAKYADNDELRELPCSHFFHKECVDKWLEINASCPLCKYEIIENDSASTTTSESSREGR